MLYAIVPYAHDPATFPAVMAAGQFRHRIAGITLVAYMSSLTSLGYTATQYALLSSAYAWRENSSRAFPAWRWKP